MAAFIFKLKWLGISAGGCFQAHQLAPTEAVRASCRPWLFARFSGKNHFSHRPVFRGNDFPKRVNG